MSNILTLHSDDIVTQQVYLDELDEMLEYMTPEIMHDPRFIFLLRYFNLYGDEELQQVCNRYLNAILN